MTRAAYRDCDVRVLTEQIGRRLDSSIVDTVTAAEQPQPAAVGHRGRERAARRPAHRRQRDRVRQPEQPREPRREPSRSRW